jgi:hypothetical protein
MQLEGIDHVALSVRDVERSAQWYMDVLGFEPRYEGLWNGIPTFIAKGTTAIALFPIRDRDSRPGARAGIDILHLAFRADRRNFLNANSKSAESILSFKITRSHNQFIFTIPMVTNSRSQPTSRNNRAASRLRRCARGRVTFSASPNWDRAVER